MKILLDTNAYSALKRGVKSAIYTVSLAEHIYLSMTVVGELLYGFRVGSREGENLKELNNFLDQSVVSLMGIDYEVCEVYARLCKELRIQGTPIPTNDLWIAATAIRHNFTLLTNDQHFLKIKGLSLECIQ